MSSYRIYRIGPGRRLHLGESFNAVDDHKAVELARALNGRGQEAELWAGGRMLGRFSKQGDFTAGAG